MKVFANGYGFVDFQIDEREINEGIAQVKGRIRLPHGINSVDGSEWIKWKYWFSLDEVYVSLGSYPDIEIKVL